MRVANTLWKLWRKMVRIVNSVPVNIIVSGLGPKRPPNRNNMDLSRFDAAPLISFTATKEMNYALHGRVMRSMIPRVGLKRTDEFRQDAVRIALTSGLTVARQSLLAAMRGAQAGSIGFGCRDVDAEQMDHGTSAARQCRSGKGNCYDNAAVETFFRTIKAEMIWRRSWETRRQAEVAIFHSHGLQANHCRAAEYVNGFYNPRSRHSALGWKSSVTFERQVA